MTRHMRSFAVLLPTLLNDVHSFAFSGSIRSLSGQQSRRICSSSTCISTTAAATGLHMTVEPIVTLLLVADGASSLSDFADQAPDVLGAASDLAGSAADLAGSAADLADSAKSSFGESLGSIGDVWGSVVDSFSSAKDQATDTTLGSVDALKAQVNELGASAISPFQRLGEDLSNSITGGLDSLKSGAQGAVEGAQTQLGESVTESIGNPLQEGLGQVFSKFGTSPEELITQEQSWTNGVQETIKGLEKVATPSTLFYAENAAILPLWVGMIVWPEEKITKAVMSTYAPVVVAAVIYMWLTYECFQNPVSLQGFASGITNLSGLTKGFGEEVSVAAAWSHFLAEDLFIGRWVYLDGQKNGVFNKHSLALCYLFGPIGFVSHLLTRTAVSFVNPGVKDIMEANVSQPKVPPATSPNSEGKKLLATARREAEAIVSDARSAGAAQAASLLEAAETEALDILKGAEVERSAMLKANKTEAATAVQAAPAADGAIGQAAPVMTKPPAPVVENESAPVVAKTVPSTSSPDIVSPS